MKKIHFYIDNTNMPYYNKFRYENYVFRKEGNDKLEKIKITLSAVRANSGMDQKEWAKAIGVSQFTISNWETGKTHPDAVQLRKMSELSGIPMDFIFVPE